MAQETEKVLKVTQKLDVSADLIKQARPVPIEQPGSGRFANIMEQQARPEKTEFASQPQTRASLMEEVAKANQKIDTISKWNTSKLVNQADEAIKRMDEVKKVLSDPNIKIKHSVQTLLQKKLVHVEDNLKIALEKAGIEYTPVDKSQAKGLLNPIKRFIGYLTHGQDQLQNLSNHIHELGITGRELSPADMISVQIKVGRIQQEIEFFTSLLNKALESTKTIMNVQV